MQRSLRRRDGVSRISSCRGSGARRTCGRRRLGRRWMDGRGLRKRLRSRRGSRPTCSTTLLRFRRLTEFWRVLEVYGLPLCTLLLRFDCTVTDCSHLFLSQLSRHRDPADNACVWPEWRIRFGRGRATDVEVMGCLLGGVEGKEGVANAETLRSRRTSIHKDDSRYILVCFRTARRACDLSPLAPTPTPRNTRRTCERAWRALWPWNPRKRGLGD